ncbi:MULTISPECIES: NCS2 family permease [Exiguobacterium]|uniref:Xanthine/uracil/vitamin C permease n=1 Tax=Exiguobacterium sibiricum (strain DSM 17290 / CCUG 55495 / CIP 109462 / JCM 13490 / 255-15) TaxID=262543 RepID=B1YJN8_EXIS2|nr:MULTISPECIES: NCS2 family permease [Exiguobacterium]ACB60068.1 Xanthine/uracil/vitamin C permease [Exiguobacterium sibiricum 255-15]MDX1260461.1 NCS2 family permease [Exiguobacterium sp. K1]
MFKLSAHDTTVKREIQAGFITFITMAYILFVNPTILSEAGIPQDQAFSATIVATLIGTLLMGFYANLPIAVAPGMGLNAYFTYTLVIGEKIPYQTALSVVFVAGIIFLLLSLSPLRTKLIEVIPTTIKLAITGGIGLFIASLGLKMSGILVADPATLITIGSLTSPEALITLVGLLVAAILTVKRVPGGLLYAMVLSGVLAFLTGELTFSKTLIALPTLPEGILVANPLSAVQDVIQYGLFSGVLSFVLVTMFDTTGTMVAVGEQAGLIEEDGSLKNSERALLSDSTAMIVGSMFGTSPTTAYVESASGVAAGGRTGLTSVTVGILFALSAVFGPIVQSISSVPAITAPALLLVGALMLQNIKQIQWEDFSEAFTAFMIIIIMPLSGSIATGIAFGFIIYPIMKAVQKQRVHFLIYLFAVLFFIQLFFLH